MSKHAIDRNGWPPEERDEYEALLADIVANTDDSTARIDLFETLLADAIQAHRPWANEVDRACRRFGMGKEISRFEDRNRVMVSYEGELMNLPAKQARRVPTTDGYVIQRGLIELFTWAQLEEKRAEALRARRTYDQKVAHYDLLLSLRVLQPSASTPAEAAELAGVDLDDWLAGRAA